ncbi:hypothetical protein ACM1TL_05190 [Lysinibacillus capsici]|uniref:Uncharacterized protein n=1 Tax=Lysinibacillus capsici TaxID=2115968 RepID=A0ABY8KMU9_9BACI|nr:MULTISPECIES: hypothetical protein [Lysinibacillus]EFI70725.1 hypothetical protein BFZC1_00045 [Lysinibacillus fusiformis ZC1]MBU5252954.1 hypothetical protein [Lysinibacillus capsici]MCT1538809.1 hypothetical protein [Lysinibacillus capsici]MCT1569517.1 hypothetical protein [Lysinibacillus capsici]MCT1646532.1 hypothetical protein [Lysinibacillus capsici]
MKKNAVISILTCFIFIFTFSPKTQAIETPDIETQALSEHIAGVVTGYTGNKIGHGGASYPKTVYDCCCSSKINIKP